MMVVMLGMMLGILMRLETMELWILFRLQLELLLMLLLLEMVVGGEGVMQRRCPAAAAAAAGG